MLVGDVMTDICLRVRDVVAGRPLPSTLRAEVLPSEGTFLVATLHRAENTDDPSRLASLVDALAAAPLPVVLAVHPRLAARANAAGLSLDRGSLHPVQPLAYGDLIAAVLASRGVVTDSGGLQKEAFILRRPCVTLRAETEWPETVELGWNVLSPDASSLDALWSGTPPAPTDEAPYGDGDAARLAVQALEGWQAPRP